jgi:hypothetical protein
MKKTITIIMLILVSTLGVISRAAEQPISKKDTLQDDYLSKQIFDNIASNPSPIDTLNPLKSVFGINIDDSQADVPHSYKYARLTEDTTSKLNRINKIWTISDKVKAEVVIVEDDANLTIKVYNMLGKEIAEIFSGLQSQKTKVYEYPTASLPNGIYICILTGKNFRDTKKFIVSR